MIVERACLHLEPEVLAHKLRNAPRWLQGSQSSRRSPGAAAAVQRRPDERDDAVGGWLVGVIAPGVSSPAYMPQDGQTLPETFAPSAWAGVMEQVARGTEPIGLWVDHNGLMVACSSARTLRLETHPLLGGMFEAKLVDSSHSRMLLHDIGRNGVAVSVAFHSPVLSYEQRDGRKVRVVQRCVVEHIALVRKTSGARALYSAARAFGVTGDDREQLRQAWSDARVAAWRGMKACG